MPNKVKIIRASAGSGKTYRLAYEYIKRVVGDPAQYSKILAVTFTNKATEEMKNRILDRLNKLSNAKEGDEVDYLDDLKKDTGLQFWQIKENARLAKSNILHDYSNFAVSTIDAFFQRIARSFFRELNLDFSYEVDLSEDSYIIEAIDRVIDMSKGDDLLAELISKVVDEHIESNSWDIRKKLCLVSKELLREGYKQSKLPARDLLGVFVKAKENLKDKKNLIVEKSKQASNVIQASGLSGVDFAQGARGFGCQIENFSQGNIEKGYNSYFLSALESSENWASKTSKQKAVITSLEGDLMPLLEEIQQLFDDYAWLNNGICAIDKNFSVYLLLDYVSIELDKLWGENNKLPIFRTTDLIADITSNSDAPFIYEKIGAHYSNYMIDEFQDTSTKQWQSFRPLIEEALGSSNVENVMLIGDVKQAIYRWRGGDWNILASKVESDFADRVNDSESLITNYRSYKNVIEFNNSLFKEIVDIESKTFGEYEKYSGLVGNAYKDYVQQSTKKVGGYVEVEICQDNLAYTLSVVDDLVKNRNYAQKDIAILVRVKKEGVEIANALVNKGYSVVSDEALLLDNSQVVRFLVSLFRLSIDVDDLLSLANVNVYLGREVTEALSGLELDLIGKIRKSDPLKSLELAMTQYGLEEKEVSYLQSFYDAVFRFTTGQSGDLGLFIEWWDQNKNSLSLAIPKGQDAITVITVHKSKGLEFDVVLLPFADWSLLPKADSSIWGLAQGGDLEEMGELLINYVKSLSESHFCDVYNKETVYSHIDNLNLLYVALTRASKELYVGINEDSLGKQNIGNLISEALQGVDFLKIDNNNYSIGERTFKEHISDSATSDVFVESLKIANAKLRVATRMPNYKLDDEQISDRAKGVKMHSLFSNVEVFEDFYKVVDLMLVNGEISDSLAIEIKQSIQQWSQNELIKKWFTDEGKLYSERGILSSQSNIKRPDRVVIYKDKVLLLDYKFGQKVEERHKLQISQYKQLLSDMGYRNIESYLWYVTINEIVHV